MQLRHFFTADSVRYFLLRLWLASLPKRPSRFTDTNNNQKRAERPVVRTRKKITKENKKGILSGGNSNIRHKRGGRYGK